MSQEIHGICELQVTNKQGTILFNVANEEHDSTRYLCPCALFAQT